jgi:hypothetical protein
LDPASSLGDVIGVVWVSKGQKKAGDCNCFPSGN